jgi:hypothetical protein
LISRRMRALAMILTGALVIAVGIAAVVWARQGHRGGGPAYAVPGDELSTADTAAYGWSGSKRVGTRFTMDSTICGSRRKPPDPSSSCR